LGRAWKEIAQCEDTKEWMGNPLNGKQTLSLRCRNKGPEREGGSLPSVDGPYKGIPEAM